ncbi:MAG: GNAT family N-acetyltransferase [Syntrophales bacterium]|jgi:spermidine synthase|nr:GNAT family N-acetyltransferase [Syntrophales bacterium]
MTSINDSKFSCAVLREPDEEQIRQIISLYRAQGWWDAGDDCQKQLAARLISGSHCFVIAADDKDIVGMGRAISDGISDAYIQDLTVRADFRMRGIGTLIIQKLIEILHADGISWIGLIAEPGSEILYSRAGFKEMVSATPMLMAEKQ